jgi:L-lysine 2,3-aminomutase
MNELEKLRVMIPHWIEHNQEHADEFQRWADAAGDAGVDILDAAATMSHVNQSLQVALEKLGGALPHNHLESNE